MKKLCLAVIIAVLTSVSCGSSHVYMEGPKEFKGVAGEMKAIPDSVPLRDLADGLQKYMLEFNFKSGASGQVNPLSDEETQYMLDRKYEAGTPQINPQAIIPGKAEIVYSNGSIGNYDRITGRFSSFELSPDLIPPADLSVSNNRNLTKDIVERIARLWFGQIDIDIKNYRANPFEIMEPTTIVFQEELKDPDTKSPNYVKAIINHWGMIVRYDINIGPTPTIGTKPTLDANEIMKKARLFLAVAEDFKLDVTPVSVIKRIYSEERDELVYKDVLAWFIDASAYKISTRNPILTLDAHTGLPVE